MSILEADPLVARRQEIHLASETSLRRRKAASALVAWGCGIATVLAIVPLVVVLVYTIHRGISAWSVGFFTHLPTPAGIPGGGISNAIVGSVIVIGMAAIMGIPFGVLVGFHLARTETRFASILRYSAEVFTGIPSIAIGIFAYALIVVPLGHFSALSASVALAVLMVPVVARATEASVRTVPEELVEGGMALGGREGTVARRVTFPVALPGILTGALLALSRALGESAPAPLHGDRESGVLYVAHAADSGLAAGGVYRWPATVSRPPEDRVGDRPVPGHRGAHAQHRGPDRRRAAPREDEMTDGATTADGYEPVTAADIEDIAVNTPVAMDLERVSVSFQGVPAVTDVTMQIQANQVTSLIGPSGSGKTTLLRTLNRLHDATRGAQVSGSIRHGSMDLYGPGTDPVLVRARIGMVFQRPNVFPTMSIYDNVVSGLRFAGVRRKELLNEAAESGLIAAALWDEVRHRLRKPATSLSGGQQQRLCIARALAVEPDVLLMDEPTSSLDPSATKRIEELLSELVDRVTIVIVTHNMQQAHRVSTQCAFLLGGDDGAGHLIESGPTNVLFDSPSDERTADYVAGRFG